MPYWSENPWITKRAKKFKGKYGPGWQNPAATEWVKQAPGGQQAQRQNPYAGMIENLLNQQRADIGAESIADAASRDAAMRRLIISWGEAPTTGLSGGVSGLLGGILDPHTMELIAQNTAGGTSIKARMDAANKLAMAGIPKNLAGRGMLRTGETGYQLAQQAQADKVAKFDAYNELTQGLEGAVGSYAANERARQRQLAEYEADAARRAFDTWEDTDFGDGGGAAGADPWSPEAGQPYGGSTDPYWNNLIDWYSNAPRGGGGKKRSRRRTRKNPQAGRGW